MAENHYVDPKDQHEAAQGIEDHSDLTVLYAETKKEDLGPWMQEDDRQVAMEKDRREVITSLRASALRIGMYLSLPVVLGILLGQFSFYRTGPGINEADAMALAFVILFLFAGWAILTYNLLKRVGETFHKHTLRPLPIVLTTLLSLIFLIRPALHYSNALIGGVGGNVVALVALLITGSIISTITIFAWTTKWIPGLVKILVLLAFFGLSVVAAYLA
jgi:hypothetical protein